MFYDGHHNIAVELGTLVRADPPCPPSDKLLHAVVQGLAIQDQSKENINIYKENVFCGIDLEFETEGTSIAPEPASYETAYVTSHKHGCRSGAFSHDGQLVRKNEFALEIQINYK